MKAHVVVLSVTLILALAACRDNTSTIRMTAGTKNTGANLEKATFAGGCFWCMESPFESLEGVMDVLAGYTGGTEEDPTYQEVSSGRTGHVESIQILFDPLLVHYETLLDIFWKQIDPTDPGGQFADRGRHYQTAIFYHNEEQRLLAEASREKLDRSGRYDKPIVTLILPASTFYRAEEYHQDYSTKNPTRYKLYRKGSGRESYLESKWGKEKMDDGKNAPSKDYSKPPEKELQKKLTSLQYEVTQKDGTEPPFLNEYWDNKQEGIYVDVVTGEPLFSSLAKYVSGTGWPSFFEPLEPDNIVEKVDRTLSMARIEVRSSHGNSHLGHVFDDGPPPTGKRYCLNSASLRFIPKDDLEKEGYGEYRALFQQR